jgi:hypothetical protein
MRWKKKPAYVEWDLVGDANHGFGAVVFRSAAPMVIVHEIEPDHPTPERVASAVQQWISLVPDLYRLNEEFEQFKASVRRLDSDPSSGTG